MQFYVSVEGAVFLNIFYLEGYGVASGTFFHLLAKSDSRFFILNKTSNRKGFAAYLDGA